MISTRHLLKPIQRQKMVISIIGTGIRLGFRYRKTIYKILTAQDRVIGSAWKRGGYGRQTRYGVRTGAAAGTLVAPFITNFAPDTPGNELQKPVQKRERPSPSKPYKARSRFPRRSNPEYSRNCPPNRYSGRSRYSQYR